MSENIILNAFHEKELKTFAERLKELRLYYDLTQSEFAEKIGIVPNTIITYEKNQKKPSVDTLIIIAKTFNISLDWLCGFKDIMTRIYPMTYADIIKTFLEVVNDDLVFGEIDSEYYDHDGLLCEFKIQAISFDCPEIQNFFKEYKKMYDLYKGETIDKDLFDMWIAKQLKDYDGRENLIAGVNAVSSSKYESEPKFEEIDSDENPPF